jgi:hypothetical protein
LKERDLVKDERLILKVLKEVTCKSKSKAIPVTGLGGL